MHLGLQIWQQATQTEFVMKSRRQEGQNLIHGQSSMTSNRLQIGIDNHDERESGQSGASVLETTFKKYRKIGRPYLSQLEWMSN